MNDHPLPPELRHTAHTVAGLVEQTEYNPRHREQLRRDLLRLHHELTASAPQAAGSLWSRLSRLKPVRLVAPPALAAALVLGVLAALFTGTGHRSPQTVQAAQMSRALARAAPTVTSWRVSVQQVSGNTASAFPCRMSLSTRQRLYIRNGQTYLYDRGRWLRLTSDPLDRQCPSQLQWPFAEFAGRLAAGKVTILSGSSRLGGHAVVRVVYASVRPDHARVSATAWVERSTGLVLRLERVVTRGKVVIERSSAEYQYQYRGKK